MTVVDELKRCGLKVGGRPAAATVEVGGRTVTVGITEDGNGVVSLNARVAAKLGGDPIDLGQASLGAPGDTAYTATTDGIEATRTLVGPPIGVLYDAIYELAKSICSMGMFVESLDFDVLTPAGPPGAAAPPGRTITVTAEQPLTGADGRAVGRLLPGRAYVAGREENGWVEVVDADGNTGWVAEAAVSRS